MKPGEDKIQQVFEAVMQQCKAERKAKTKTTLRQLAQDLGATENYLSAVENGREFPSMRLFIKYLLTNGFDIGGLKGLEIKPVSSKLEKEMKHKHTLAQKIYALNPEQIEYLAEQVSLTERYGIKKK